MPNSKPQSASRTSLKFAEEYVAPIHKEEKTATVRYGLDRPVEVGDAPEIVVAERLESIAYSLDRILDELEGGGD